MPSTRSTPYRFVRNPEAQDRLGISRSSLYAFSDPKSPSYRAGFPQRVRQGSLSGFIDYELDAYLKGLMEARK